MVAKGEMDSKYPKFTEEQKISFIKGCELLEVYASSMKEWVNEAENFPSNAFREIVMDLFMARRTIAEMESLFERTF